MAIANVLVVGSGTMGNGIAQVCAQAGLVVTMSDVSSEVVAKGRAAIEKSLAKLVEKAKLTGEARDQTLARITTSTDVEGPARTADLIVEAVPERMDLKLALFKTFSAAAPLHAILATNTSSLSVTEIASATHDPARVVGLHFFNPVPVMRLVEVVRGLATSDETVAAVTAFARALGKEPVACRDNSGFIVNRLLVPFLLDAIRAHEQGVGSLEDIDTGMKLGCAHPMGPFELLDYVGLDTVYAIGEIMFAEYREARFAPPALLKRLVLAGRFGRRTGRGFFEYDQRGNRRP